MGEFISCTRPLVDTLGEYFRSVATPLTRSGVSQRSASPAWAWDWAQRGGVSDSDPDAAPDGGPASALGMSSIVLGTLFNLELVVFPLPLPLLLVVVVVVAVAPGFVWLLSSLEVDRPYPPCEWPAARCPGPEPEPGPGPEPGLVLKVGEAGAPLSWVPAAVMSNPWLLPSKTRLDMQRVRPPTPTLLLLLPPPRGCFAWNRGEPCPLEPAPAPDPARRGGCEEEEEKDGTGEEGGPPRRNTSSLEAGK